MSLNRRQLLRWHVWLGWLIGVPLVLWTVTGLVMVARPIDAVRGTDLRVERPQTTIPRGFVPALPFLAPDKPTVSEYTVQMHDEFPVARVTYDDGSQAVFDAQSGRKLTPIDEARARQIVREGITSATDANVVSPRDTIVTAKLFAASQAPFDFRQPKPVWQVRLADGTHVYVGRDSGEIEAVRTRWWRVFDFMWGLHIMDLQTREDTHHPILVVFTAIAAFATVLAVLLMIARYAPRRRARNTRE